MNQEKSIKMRNMPMGRLIATMSIPAMFSMLIQALYNVVDSIYVARLDTTNDDMLTAVGYAFPIQILIMAFALGIGIGTNVLAAKKLGERKPDESSQIAQNGIMMAVIAGIFFFIMSFIIINPFMNLMSNSENIIKNGTAYLRIVSMFSIFIMIEITCNKILQSMGRMIIPMFTQLIGAITNIILDPILIFGWHKIPAMGIRGAAIATVIGQAVAMIFVVIYILTTKFEINLKLKHFRFNTFYVKEIIKVGLPSMIMNAIGSITNIFLNSILKSLNPEETANAVLTSYFKLQSFVFMPVFGINQGGMPILSYNYGAKIKKRFFQGLRIMIFSALIIMGCGLIVFQIFPKQLLNFFSPSKQMIEIGVRALRIISISFIPAAISIIITMAFQSLGRGETALMMSILRQAILLVPSAFILGKIGGLNLVWYAFPLSEIAVAVIFLPIIIVLTNRVFDKNPLEIN